MIDFDTLVVLLSLLLALVCTGLFIAYIFIHRQRNAILIDAFRDLRNEADKRYKNTNNKIDKEIYLAYKNAFSKAIDLSKRGML